MQRYTLALLLSLSTFAHTTWYQEQLNKHWQQCFHMDEILYEQKTDHHHLIIFKNAAFGNVLALDGIIQTTERDEFVYHEMIVHVPMLSHGNAKKVLIIGGGDGGVLREVLRHKTVEQATLVDIDRSVIDLSKKFFPHHSQGAFQDPRTRIVIDDGCAFVKQSQEQYDIIIVDSTDPIGAGEQLFTDTFFGDCHRCLAPRGILVNQNGVPFTHPEELATNVERLQTHFAQVRFYIAAIPTYVGGYMAFGWATDCPEYSHITEEELANRFSALAHTCTYYTPEIHTAAFALPQYIKNALPS